MSNTQGLESVTISRMYTSLNDIVTLLPSELVDEDFVDPPGLNNHNIKFVREGLCFDTQPTPESPNYIAKHQPIKHCLIEVAAAQIVNKLELGSNPILGFVGDRSDQNSGWVISNYSGPYTSVITPEGSIATPKSYLPTDLLEGLLLFLQAKSVSQIGDAQTRDLAEASLYKTLEITNRHKLRAPQARQIIEILAGAILVHNYDVLGKNISKKPGKVVGNLVYDDLGQITCVDWGAVFGLKANGKDRQKPENIFTQDPLRLLDFDIQDEQFRLRYAYLNQLLVAAVQSEGSNIMLANGQFDIIIKKLEGFNNDEIHDLVEGMIKANPGVFEEFNLEELLSVQRERAIEFVTELKKRAFEHHKNKLINK